VNVSIRPTTTTRDDERFPFDIKLFFCFCFITKPLDDDVAAADFDAAATAAVVVGFQGDRYFGYRNIYIRQNIRKRKLILCCLSTTFSFPLSLSLFAYIYILHDDPEIAGLNCIA